ncbi:MAG TPA: O-antigen ligase family protein [Gaiellaceae bacterium]|nr:O-antigen ligase family protein [Gaiellaceae bacterium]
MIGLAHLGGPIACLGLALLLVARTQRERLAGLGFAAFGACVLGAAVAPHTHVVLLVGGVLAALGLGLGLALAYRRFPWLLPLAALACVPVRIGVHLGGASTKLLVPLYVVIGGATILLAWDLASGDRRTRELRAAAWPLALYLAWTGLSISWSRDVTEGAVELLAFYVPFTLLAICLARLPWSRLGLRLLLLELTAMGLAFAVVGFYQYDTRNIFENPKLGVSNAYAPFFRVNSVFWDPSIYGRFLVISMAPLVVLVALQRSLRLSLAAAAALVVLWAGLLISFSQSSFAALLVVVIGVAFAVWRWRALLAVVLAFAVLAGIAVAQPQVRRQLQRHTTHGLNQASSGRASLVAQGIRIAKAHPVRGVGVGGFKRAYAQRVHLKGKNPKKAASHDTAVTVAAETGAPGLVLFVWLLVALLRQAFRRAGPVGLVAGLGIAAIFAHSLFYNDFFEDPLTWMLVGLVALASPLVVPVRRRAPAAQVEQREAVPV